MADVLMQWQWEPWLLACIAAAVVPYVLGMLRMGARRAQILGRWRAASFFAGMVILLLALVSPLDAVADDLFSAHMGQHMLLLLVIPAMLVYGRPVITWLWAFDTGARRTIAGSWQRWADPWFRWLMRPLVVWILLAVALCFWHLPGPYDAAVRHEWLHDLEHLSFLLVSLQFWTIVIEPYRQRRALGYGGTVVFVVSSGVVMGLIGAVLTFARMPLYGVYLHTTSAYGLTPLEDQQVAGIIMWIPSNLVHAAALCTVFFAWYRADELRADRDAVHVRAGRPVANGSGQAASATSRGIVHSLLVLLALPLLAVVLAGCTGGGGGGNATDQSSGNAHAPAVFASAPDPQRGAQLIGRYGCGSCHTIPGVSNANGLVGPPLTHWSGRSYIAGVLPNSPDNLAFWIQHPQQVVPGVAMPDMGVKQSDARDIAAYLDTIK